MVREKPGEHALGEHAPIEERDLVNETRGERSRVQQSWQE
jgi:hypothetical protein